MQRKYKKISNDILFYLASAGVLFIAATSPFFLINITRAIIRQKKFKSSRDEDKVYRALQRLKMSDYIYLGREGDKYIMKLTEKGENKIKKIYCHDLKIKKPDKWDRKWRVVIFDIPDKHLKKQRDALREKLKILGFYQLQKSVWVHPYPCEKEVGLLCDLYDIREFVDILIAESAGGDRELRNFFSL